MRETKRDYTKQTRLSGWQKMDVVCKVYRLCTVLTLSKCVAHALLSNVVQTNLYKLTLDQRSLEDGPEPYLGMRIS